MASEGSHAPAGWEGEAYARVAAPQQAWGRELADAFPWRGDETVIDAGCGSGELTQYVLDHVPSGRLIAVDADPSMVNQARLALEGALEGGRAELHQSDLLDFTPARAADVVFSNAVFHWVAEQDRMFARCFSWLSPGGWLWVQCGGEGNLKSQMALIEELSGWEPFAARLAGFHRGSHLISAAQARERLARCGFQPVEAWIESKQPQFDSDEAFEAYVRTIILRPYRSPLGPELWDSFARSFVDLHLERLGRGLDYARLNLRARRPAE